MSATGLDFDSMLVGKTAALADWRFRKEQAEFTVLVNRLRVRNWQQKVARKLKAAKP